VSLVHGGDLLGQVLMVDGKVADPGRVPEGLLAVQLFRSQRGDSEHEATEGNETTGDQLDSEGHEPLGAVGRQAFVDNY